MNPINIKEQGTLKSSWLHILESEQEELDELNI